METVKVGDHVKHKTIAWMNNGEPFIVVKIEDGKAICEYTGRNDVKYYHEFDLEQLRVVNSEIKA